MANFREPVTASPSNLVGISANKVDARSEVRSRGFSVAWKSACRDLLVLYKDDPANRVGRKRLSFQDVRDRIMERHDVRDGGVFVPDGRLTRSELWNWMSGTKGISDEKFFFIDEFVLRLSLTSWYKDVLPKLTRAKQVEQGRSLRELYTYRNLNYLAECIESYSDYVEKPMLIEMHNLFRPEDLTTNLLKDVGLYLFYIHPFEGGVARVTVLLTNRDFDPIAGGDNQDIAYYFGYLVPVSPGANDLPSAATLLMFQRELLGGVNGRGFETGHSSNMVYILDDYLYLNFDHSLISSVWFTGGNRVREKFLKRIVGEFQNHMPISPARYTETALGRHGVWDPEYQEEWSRALRVYLSSLTDRYLIW